MRLEQAIDSMQAEERGVLQRSQRRTGRLRQSMTLVIGICLFLGLWGAIVMPRLFASGITVRIESLAEAISRLAAGAPLDPLPRGQDEIGALSTGIGRAAAVLRQKTMAIENAMHGIAMVDALGRCSWCNRAYRKLTGLSSDSGAIADAVHPEDREKLRQALEQLRETGRGEVELRLLSPWREPVDASIAFLPACGDPGSYYIFVLDISLQKHVDAELISAKDAAVAANAAKTAFLAKISHEIRTPMNAILGAADLLSESALAPDQAEYVAMFRRNCRRLVALINDFLDFAKIEAGAMRLDKAPFLVRQTVVDAVETFRETAVRKGVALEIDIAGEVPEWRLGDSMRMQQVVMNLVSNALKFTTRGAVRVRVLATGGPGELVRFEVSDTGPGIGQHDQQKLFAPFTQLGQPGASRVPGSGLGLAICRELVQLMGGEISLSSQTGLGSTFAFTLPLEIVQPGERAVAAQSDAVAPLPRRSRNVRLLIAEDGPDNRVLLQHYLKSEAIDFQFAENGQFAIDAILAGETVDLILMDLDMPVVDGIEAVQRILAWQLSRGLALTPVIALSAHAIPELVEASLNAGCVAHITKPVDRLTLLKAVYQHAIVEQPAAERSLEQESAHVPPEVAALAPQYLTSKWKQLEEASARLAAQDLGAVRRFGHNLKGTGRGYGFPRIERIGRRIETAAADGETPRIQEQFEELRDFLNDTCPAVTAR